MAAEHERDELMDPDIDRSYCVAYLDNNDSAAAASFAPLTALAAGRRGRGARAAAGRLSAWAGEKTRFPGSRWERSDDFRRTRDAARGVRQSAGAALGRHNGPQRSLRSPPRCRRRRSRPVSGVRRQLRTFGLPRLVVSAVGAVSCVRATAASTTPTASTPRGPPPRGLFHCVWRVRDGQLEIQAPHYPTLQDTLDSDVIEPSGSLAQSRHGADAGLRMTHWIKSLDGWFDRRLGISDTLLPMMRHPIPRAVDGPMGWWYVFGSASLTLLVDSDRHRHRPGAGLRAGGRQGV